MVRKENIEIKNHWALPTFRPQSLLLLGPDKIVDFGVGFDDWPVFFVFWVEHFGILKMLNETVEALKPSIRQYTNLL